MAKSSKQRKATTRRRRILFVCFADSSHSQSWIDLLATSDFDVRVFAYTLDTNGRYPPQPWQFPTYVLVKPNEERIAARIISLLPGTRRLRRFVNLASYRFDLLTRWLAHAIRSWKPDIVHSFSINPAGNLTYQALSRIPKAQRPKWIVSSWGSDLNLGIHEPEQVQQIEGVLRHCDGFFSDCRRDIRQALDHGLSPDKVAIYDGIPVTGGMLPSLVQQSSSLKSSGRKLIIVPKAYEETANKTLSVLEALRMVEEVTVGYEIHLFMCSYDVRIWLRTLPESLRQRCHCHGTIPNAELVEMLKRARVMIAPSLSDGTPITMLEAMACGALPLMSPLESIREWIDDGRNGLLAHALYPDQLARALRRALTDDEFCDSAAKINRQIITERANRNVIRTQALDYYRHLLSAPSSEPALTTELDAVRG
ncbi:MAG: glycosyltransferase family 4 protein [bacterium]